MAVSSLTGVIIYFRLVFFLNSNLLFTDVNIVQYADCRYDEVFRVQRGLFRSGPFVQRRSLDLRCLPGHSKYLSFHIRYQFKLCTRRD